MLTDKIPTEAGFQGCVRYLEINGVPYNFAASPAGNAVTAYDVGKNFQLFAERRRLWGAAPTAWHAAARAHGANRKRGTQLELSTSRGLLSTYNYAYLR